MKSFLSFESVFVLWLFSYQYKNAFEVFTSPDITVVLTLPLILWGIFLFYKNKAPSSSNASAVLPFLGLSLWFIASSFWSPSEAYKLQKTLCYAIYTIPGFLMGYFIISQNPERFKRLMMAFFVFSALVLLESYRVFFVNGLATISDILNTNYLVTGQTLGTGLLVLIPYSYFALTLRNHEEKRGAIPPLWFWLLFLSSLFFYVLINLGGRGPVIATSAALTVFYGAILYGTKHRQGLPSNARHLLGIHLGALVTLCTLSYFTLNGLFEHTGSHFQQRVAPLLAGQIDEAVNERFTYYQSSFESFLDHPFLGVGFGGWPVSHSLGDVSLHPHNIFLEILSETGLIGFTLFMVFLYCIFRNFNVVFMVSTPERLSLGLLTIFSFINSQKTGDLHDNLLLFVTLSLCAGIKNWKNDHVHRPLRI